MTLTIQACAFHKASPFIAADLRANMRANKAGESTKKSAPKRRGKNKIMTAAEGTTMAGATPRIRRRIQVQRTRRQSATRCGGHDKENRMRDRLIIGQNQAWDESTGDSRVVPGVIRPDVFCPSHGILLHFNTLPGNRTGKRDSVGGSKSGKAAENGELRP